MVEHLHSTGLVIIFILSTSFEPPSTIWLPPVAGREKGRAGIRYASGFRMNLLNLLASEVGVKGVMPVAHVCSMSGKTCLKMVGSTLSLDFKAWTIQTKAFHWTCTSEPLRLRKVLWLVLLRRRAPSNCGALPIYIPRQNRQRNFFDFPPQGYSMRQSLAS